MIRTLLLAMASLCACAVQARQIMWTERPIALDIASDAETQLVLPAPVRVRVPAAHTGVLTVESFGRHVLLRPRAEIASARLVLQNLLDHSVILVDLSTRAGASAEPVEILLPAPAADARSSTGVQGADRLDPRVALIRYAAREYYAPHRLRGGLAATSQPVGNGKVDLLTMEGVEATPRASWFALQMHVTAVELRNTSEVALDLDPQRLQGAFDLAAFHSTRLLPVDHPFDRTLVFLVSQRPFAEALRGGQP